MNRGTLGKKQTGMLEKSIYGTGNLPRKGIEILSDRHEESCG